MNEITESDDSKDKDPKAVLNESSASPGGLGLGTLLQRFLIAYTFLFMLPFPLGMLDVLNAVPGFETSPFANGLQFMTGLHGKLTSPVVQTVAKYLTGHEVSMEVTGSGDGLGSYIHDLLTAAIAFLLALAWWAWRRSAPISAVVIEWNRILLRYFLFTIMQVYGFSKLIPGGQFPPLGPDKLLQPYGEASPMGLLWSFMGASTGYTMFGGAAEILGGVLLLFRRTTLLGSLVVAAVMTNVFVLNLCYDVPVKLFSFHCVFFALILATPDLGRLFAFFIANKAVPARDQRAPWASSPRLSRAFLVIKIVWVLLSFKHIIGYGMSWYTAGQEKLDHPLRGIYQVESFTVGDPPTPVANRGEDAAKRWVRVGLTPTHSITLQRADGSTTRMSMRLDMETSELAIYERGTPKPEENSMQFELLEGDLLRIKGEFEGRQIKVILRRSDQKSLLTSRGFHWISEVPFHR